MSRKLRRVNITSGPTGVTEIRVDGTRIDNFTMAVQVEMLPTQLPQVRLLLSPDALSVAVLAEVLAETANPPEAPAETESTSSQIVHPDPEPTDDQH